MHLTLELLNEHAKTLQKQLDEYNLLWQQCLGSLNYVKGQIAQLQQQGAAEDVKTYDQEEECAAR